MWYLIVFAFVAAAVCWIGPFVVMGAAAFAFCVGAVEYVTSALAGFTPYGDTKHLNIAPPAPSDDGPDPAYRSYYAGPVLLDYQKVLAATFKQIWAKVVEAKPDERTGIAPPSWLNRLWHWQKITAPGSFGTVSAVVVSIGLVIGTAAAMAFVAVTSLIFLLLLLGLVLGALGVAGGSRLAELGLLFLRGITLECPTCHEKVIRPIYRCPQCNAAHRRLVPGTTGVLHRTCACHTPLPTLLLLGKTKLRSYCTRHMHPLPLGGLSAPTVHIPVIAGPTAGKSVFMFSAMSRLMLRGNGFEFADERAKDEFEDKVKQGVHTDPSRAVKTVVTRPRAYNVYVGAEGSRSRRLLYLYDPAGEHVESVEHLANAQFLGFTKGIVFVVDPFSLRQVRSETDRTVLGKVRASNTAPKDVLERFVEALVEKGISRSGKRITIPVAVVLTKADGLLGLSGVRHPYTGLQDESREGRDAAVRSWLDEVGQHDLMSSLDNHFSTVSCFAVSYEDAVDVSVHGSLTNDDPAAPVMWLLDKKGRP